jgi:hypothetical protein
MRNGRRFVKLAPMHMRPFALQLSAVVVALSALMTPRPANATCTCECVESQERAICMSVRDPVPVCGKKACPAAPWIPKPSDSKLPAPAGTYGCEPMRVYDRSTNKHWWSELCVTSSRSGVAYVRRGVLPIASSPSFPSASAPSRARRSTSSPSYGGGALCDTDSDCPAGSTCNRRSTNDPWTCHPR